MFVWCIHLCIGPISHIWEKICSLFLYDPGSIYIIWCSLISSIYLQMTQFPPSFWQNKTTQHLYICIYVYICVCVYIYIYIYICVYIYALNIGVQVSLLFPDLHSLRYLLKSGITGLYGSCIFTLSINFHTTFHNSYTNLYSHQ
jgi:hypothetical protein